MRPLLDYTSAAYHDLLDFAVLDKTGAKIGLLYGMWSDQHTGRFEFVGIKTGLFSGLPRLVPAVDVQVDEKERQVQVPFDLAFIKGAPKFDAGAEIKEKHEAEIHRYYDAARPRPKIEEAAAEDKKTSAVEP